MDVRSISVLLFCCISGAMIGSTLNQADNLSIEDTVTHLKRKITQMEEKLSSFENTETSDLIRKLSMAVLEAEKRILEDKNQLMERMEEMEAKAKDARNDLSVKLQEVASKREEEIIKRVSEVEMRCVESTTDISARLQNAEVRLLRMDTHLLVEVQQAREKSAEAIERVRIAEQEVASALESKTDVLQVKMNETLEMFNSFVASHRDTENVIRKNISSSTEKLRYLNDSLSSRLESLTTKMRIFENSLLEIEKDYANISFVSKLDQSLQHLDKAIKTDIQFTQSELSPRVKQLEERCALGQDVAELSKTLRNHTSQIAALNTDLLDIHNSCPDPPEIANGYPFLSHKRIQDTKNGAVVTYACRGNWTLAGNGGIVCLSGEWTDLPECMNSCNTEDLKDSDGLDIPMHIIIQHSKSLDIRCLRGYVIASTSESLTCLNGTWHASGDLCMKESCDDEPPAVRNGKTVDFERKLGSNVRYQCDRSFVMSRNSTVRCRKGEWEGQPPVCSLFDATFYLQTWTVPSWIECYSVDNYQKIDFSRVLDTGSDAHLLGDVKNGTEPGYSYIYSDNPRSPWYYGSFQCGFSDERGSMNIVVQKQDVSGDLYFVDPFRVANIGDSVELEVKFNKVKSIRWRHNGVDVPSWNNEERVEIPNVQPTDAGTYECYYEGQRGVTAPALLRLIVRKCQKNLFGEHCDQQCPPCYNGGICHDYLGLCVCPSGFNGNNCEVACGEGRYGADCSRYCGIQCKKHLFCRPDPYGCSCAPGWKGIKCDKPCEPGRYGADCKQPCHCSRGHRNCNRWRGTCSGGCSPGWTGQSCQIQVVF